MNEEIKEPSNLVELTDGNISLGRWKNKDQNKSYYRALQDKDLMGIKDEDSKDKAVMKVTQDWLLAYSVWNGSGFLKGDTLEKTYENIQELDIMEATVLGKAFNKFATDMVESIKKK